MRQAVISADNETLAEFGFGVFQDAGLLDIEVLSCEGSRGVSRIYVEEQPDEQQLDALDTIQWWERVSTEESAYVYLVELNVTEELDTLEVDTDGIPRAERVVVHDRRLSFEQAGSQERISTMIADMEAAGFDITLERLGNYRVEETPLDGLTDRQQEVLEAAYERGYYDVPRSASTDEIAAELGVDDSTVSEHLQRAEHNLLATILD